MSSVGELVGLVVREEGQVLEVAGVVVGLGPVEDSFPDSRFPLILVQGVRVSKGQLLVAKNHGGKARNRLKVHQLREVVAVPHTSPQVPQVVEGVPVDNQLRR